MGRRSMALFDTTVGVNDACLLEPLDEDHFVENLRSRFHHSIIYVSTPFTDFDLFYLSDLTLYIDLDLGLDVDPFSVYRLTSAVSWYP